MELQVSNNNEEKQSSGPPTSDRNTCTQHATMSKQWLSVKKKTTTKGRCKSDSLNDGRVVIGKTRIVIEATINKVAILTRWPCCKHSVEEIIIYINFLGDCFCKDDCMTFMS